MGIKSKAMASTSGVLKEKVPLAPNPEDFTPDEAFAMAKFAEFAERWEDMTEYMKRAFSDKNGDYLAAPEDEAASKPGVEMRNQISVAYKNRVAARRTAFRQVELCMTGTLENFRDLPDDQKAHGEQYKNKISGELKALIDEVCQDVVKKF